MAVTAVSLEGFAILIDLVLLLGCLVERFQGSPGHKLFPAMLIVHIGALLCDLFGWAWNENPEHLTALYILNFLTYFLNYTLMVLFNFYLLKFVNYEKKQRQIFSLCVILLCGVAVGMIVLSFFNGAIFRFSGASYARGKFFWVSQVFPIMIILFNLALLVKNYTKVNRAVAISFLAFGLCPAAAMLIQIKVYGLPLLGIAITLSLLIVFVTIYMYQARTLLEKDAELAHLNNAILLSQIQPHFLFNALCAIQDLAHEKAPEAEAATIEFSRFLRGNLQSLTEAAPISFEQELAHTKSYLYIEKLRFEDRLQIEYAIEATDFRIPTLTLQPLVENAVRHGICKKEDGGTVRIASREEPGAFIVEVQDDGVGFAELKEHIGVPNVRERLRTMCGGTLALQSKPGLGTTATIRIPKEEKA